VVDLSDAELYGKHAEELTRFATGLVGPQDAPDVVSAAVLACMFSKGWSALENPRAYLFRAVLNQARQLRRASARRVAREQQVPGRAWRGSEDEVDPPEVRPEILAAVMALSLRQRAVTVLTYWSDRDPERSRSFSGSLRDRFTGTSPVPARS
jgi:DNA-directed RNA polymerase specialized sigma24 family protein